MNEQSTTKVPTKLRISEVFESIQGEGPTSGVPSIFLRLTGCNLLCGGKGTEKDGKLHNGATWRCDSIEVWRKGKGYDLDQLSYLFSSREWWPKLHLRHHLVITGGEPLLQADAVNEFIRLDKLKRTYIEVETNGTIFDERLFERVDQWNISPKLKNSGETKERRIVEPALREYAKRGKCFFKFVINSRKDFDEIISDFSFVPLSKIVLMPGSSTREEMIKNSQLVVDLCTEHGLRHSSRLQLVIWDKKTGV